MKRILRGTDGLGRNRQDDRPAQAACDLSHRPRHRPFRLGAHAQIAQRGQVGRAALSALAGTTGSHDMIAALTRALVLVMVWFVVFFVVAAIGKKMWLDSAYEDSEF